MDLPKRKPNRLKDWDYSHPGAYFVTICTRERAKYFWDGHVGERMALPPLSKFGKIMNEAILNIPKRYPSVRLDHYAVMPNHVHLLLSILTDENGSAMRSPTIQTVINQLKGHVTKRIGTPLFQRSFHDHIIRDEKDYQLIWQYIDQNPLKWELDCFYIP